MNENNWIKTNKVKIAKISVGLAFWVPIGILVANSANKANEAEESEIEYTACPSDMEESEGFTIGDPRYDIRMDWDDDGISCE